MAEATLTLKHSGSRLDRYKGVFPQQNGHWGAQIYSNHHRIWLKSEADAAINANLSTDDGGEYSCSLLFQKELTPSDVGKLNRLVVPKRHAVKHFPSVPEGGRAEEVQLEFYDREMNPWKFRYCYWKSSQSFVLTRGWNRFVKEKGLRANDTIYFYSYQTPRSGGHYAQSFLLIDFSKICKTSDDTSGEEYHTTDAKPPGFRLFGVQIH